MKNKENKIYKGDYGYINSQRKIDIIKTAVLFALPFALYAMGYITTGSNKNLLTFVAILGVLPLAASGINLVLFIRAKGCSEDAYKKIVGAGIQATYYDMYFTSYKKNYPVSALILKKGTFIALTEDSAVNLSEAEEHIKGILANCGGEKISVQFFNDTDAFIERAKKINSLDKDDKDYTFILENIVNVAL